MTAFVVRYRAYDGTETERRISDLVVDESKGVDAFCHLRNERRTTFSPKTSRSPA